MLHAHMTLSDKPFMGSVTEPSRAQDSVEMCEILFGKDFVQENAVMTSLININSPMTFDDVMMGALEVYSKNNQACIVSPFIVGGAMAPVSVAGTLTQVLAEVMAGISYSQLVRKGAPVIFGAFVSSIDMNSGNMGFAIICIFFICIFFRTFRFSAMLESISITITHFAILSGPIHF